MRILFALTCLLSITWIGQGRRWILRTSISSDSFSPRINPADFQADLDANRAKWAATGIKSYTLRERMPRFWIQDSRGPFDVTVTDGEIRNVQFSESSKLVGAPTFTSALLTIDEAFERVQGILRMDPPVSRFSIQYDKAQGYITSFFVDRIAEIADDEVQYFFWLVQANT